MALGGIAGTVFYYRDGIQDAFAGRDPTPEEISLEQRENEYDFERQKANDKYWDNVWNGNNSKNQTKQAQKNGNFDPNNDPSKFNPPNSEYNKTNPYGYNNTKTGRVY